MAREAETLPKLSSDAAADHAWLDPRGRMAPMHYASSGGGTGSRWSKGSKMTRSSGDDVNDAQVPVSDRGSNFAKRQLHHVTPTPAAYPAGERRIPRAVFRRRH